MYLERVRTRRAPREKAGARERLLATSSEVFRESGYRAASLDDILRRSGVAKSNFYYHFAGKLELACAAVDLWAEHLGTRLLAPLGMVSRPGRWFLAWRDDRSGRTMNAMARWFQHEMAAGYRLEVADSGSGIAADNLAHVFEPFFSTKQGGTGLGLALTQQIVTEHAGSIDVHSEPGKGTTFTVRIPAAPSEPVVRAA